jgi:hypothetical protein
VNIKQFLRIGKLSLGASLLLAPFYSFAQTNLNAPGIFAPTNGQIFVAPANITIGASISYGAAIPINGTNVPPPTNVVVFANSNNLGRVVIMVSSGFGGFGSVTWPNPLPGAYTLTALGTNDTGAVISSPPVNIIVHGLVLQLSVNGNIIFQTYGSPGKSFEFEASTNLQTWQDLGLATADTNGFVQFTDTNASIYKSRFYQSIPH